MVGWNWDKSRPCEGLAIIKTNASFSVSLWILLPMGRTQTGVASKVNPSPPSAAYMR